MAVRVNQLIRLVFLSLLSTLAAQAWAAGVNFAGSTDSAAAAVAMNSSTTHISDIGQARPLLVSAPSAYPPVDYKRQVFQSVWSEIRVPDARDPKRNQAILKNNAKLFAKLADMYNKTTAYAVQQNRKLVIDVLTVQAAGGAKGYASSRKFAEYIFKSLKENGVENIALDPPPRDPIPLPPGLTDQQPRGKT